MRAGGIGLVFARARNGHLDEHCGNGSEDHHGQRAEDAASAIAIAVAAAAAEHGGPSGHARQDGDGSGKGGGNGADEDVAVADMAEFVRQHAFQFVVVEQIENAGGDGDGGVIGVSSGGKGVGRSRLG